MSWLSRVVNVFRQERVTDELDEELQFHVESRARDLIADGLAPDEAYREARRRLGNAGVIRERSREVKLVAGLDALMRDMRFAIRMLRRDLVVSLAAIASLALAIGGCTAAFALVDALILRPLPVRDPATLVSVGVLEGGDRDRTSFNYPLFTRLVEAARGRVELAAFSYQSPSLATFDATGGEERVHEQFVSGNGFGMLGVTPALGRVIVPSDDDLAGGRAVAVLSHGFWTRRFGRDPRVIGRTFTLGRKTYQIVGVAREGFTGIEPGISTSLWMPLTSTPERSSLSLTDPGWHWFKVMGRLAPGHRADEGPRSRCRPCSRTFAGSGWRWRGRCAAGRTGALPGRAPRRAVRVQRHLGPARRLRAALVDPGRGRDAGTPARVLQPREPDARPRRRP